MDWIMFFLTLVEYWLQRVLYFLLTPSLNVIVRS